MVGSPILAESLRMAKAKPMFFAFVAKGQEGTLLVNKARLPRKDYEEAKRQQGGGLVFRGVCHWQEGQMVFEVSDEPPVNLASQIKKTIKRDAELTMDVVTRFSQDLADGDKKDDEPPAREQMRIPGSNEDLQKEEQARQSEREEQEVRSLLLEVSSRCKSALSGPNGQSLRLTHGEKIQGLLQTTTELMRKTDFKQALTRLKDLKNLLNNLPGALPPPSLRNGTELLSELQELGEPIKALLQGGHAPRVKELVKGFKAALENNDFEAAGMVLKELEGFVKQPPGGGETTAKWLERFAKQPPGNGEVTVERKLDSVEWKLEIEKTLKTYQVGKTLGAGATGEAKLLEPGESGWPSLVAKFPNQPKYKKLLEDEERIYRQVGDHPNIPRCLGVVEVDGKPALVLEYVDEGVDVKKTMANMRDRYKQGELSQEEYWGAIQYMTAKTLQTLAHIEEQGLVHSDIKPENLMIDKNGELKVIDLGGAVATGANRGQYTQGYAPPEEKGITGTFDVFSTGEVAKEATTSQQRTEKVTQYTDFLQWLTNPTAGQRPSAKDALAHPFLAGSLLDDESARKVLAGVKESRPLPVTSGFDQASWDQTMAQAVNLKLVKAGSGATIAKVSDALRQLAEPPAQFKKLRRESAWPEKSQAMTRASELAEAIVEATKQLQDEGKAPQDLKVYLREMGDAASKLLDEIKKIQELGPPELTTAKFADKWRAIKKEAEIGFQAAVKTIKENLGKQDGPLFNQLANQWQERWMEDQNEEEAAKIDPRDPKVMERAANRILAEHGLDKPTTAEKFFKFSDNFSGSLDDLEKAASRQDKSLNDKKAKALNIAKKYFGSVRSVVAARGSAAFNCGVAEVETGFLARLMLRLNDLVYSIDQK